MNIKVPSYNDHHPECGEDEVFYSNIEPSDFDAVRWKTKRRGTDAFDMLGNPLPNLIPVFIRKEEYERRWGQ